MRNQKETVTAQFYFIKHRATNAEYAFENKINGNWRYTKIELMVRIRLYAYVYIVVAWGAFICIEEHGHMYRKCV